MKILSYAWLITANIVTLFIAWLLYSIANTRFEIIIVSLLLVIYTRLDGLSSAIVLLLDISGLSSNKRFIHILRILKRNDSAYKENIALMDTFKSIDKNDDFKPSSVSLFEMDFCEDEDSKQSIKKQEDDLKRRTIQSYISGIFTFLIYALAVWKIITTLF